MGKTGDRISESEIEVLKVLWDESPLAAVDLATRVPEARNWSLTTVKTLLARLVDKRAVGAVREGRRYLYSPLIARDALSGRQAKHLVDRLFGGRVSPLVAQLADQRELDEADLKELEALVRRLRK